MPMEALFHLYEHFKIYPKHKNNIWDIFYFFPKKNPVAIY